MKKKQPNAIKKQSEQDAILKIIFGNILLGFAYAKWMVPHAIINGGVTSLSLVLSKVLTIDVAYLTNMITVLLLIVCWLFLGRERLLKSIVSSVSYLFFFTFFHQWSFSAVVNLPIDFLLASSFIAGGYYFCLSAGSSTVGMDVIALIVHQKRPTISLAKVIRWLNYTVLILGFITYGWQSIVIGILFSFIYSWLLERFLRNTSM
ncbi:YitT family protein [Enterococcus saccharolyticus]|uniref:YitT family protein n=1 Tax=Enterococcus TaxID=1350 RepID=UPI001E48EAF2|nr:YitT family protein [Enterococcus saccharolyticus]MCD5001898.1 YitT family protein [Enterococcus saccharolyticus]